jgi:uncharacterized membrane protein
MMPDIEGLLNRWQSAGVLETASADRIRAWERQHRDRDGAVVPESGLTRKVTGIAWQGMVALAFGGLLLACGLILFVSAHWNDLGPGARLSVLFSVLALLHLGGGAARTQYRALSTTLHGVGTATAGACIALVGQIFHMQEHWPAAVLLWAVAALAGWALLRDQVQQTLALLLVPAWMFTELEYATELHIGQAVYLGRFLLGWAVLYLTAFLHSRRKGVRVSLFTAGSMASVAGAFLLLEGWRSWAYSLPFVPLSTRVWAWAVIAALPLLLSLFSLRRSAVPVTLAIFLGLVLPFAQRLVPHGSFTEPEPNLVAQVLVGAFAVFLIVWGVRQVSRSLVNVGVTYFAITICWFYFSDIFSKIGRSLGLIGLGILFLAGGWALERTRRRLLGRMADGPADLASIEGAP